MESQIQCPVCTLYLHAGMNLQDHLESHPKEKVIAALVNLTLFQQQSNDDCVEGYDCNQYESSSQQPETQPVPVSLPLVRTVPSSIATRTYHQNNHAITSFGAPIQQHSSTPAAHQVMIVDRTRVFHERSNVAVNDEGCKRRILTQSVPSIIASQPKIRTIPVQALQLITTNGLTTNQQIQTLRPPPPYCVSVKDNLLKQTGPFFQQNRPRSRSNENVGVEKQCNKYQPHDLPATATDSKAANVNTLAAFEDDEHRKQTTLNIYNVDEHIQVEYEAGYDPDEVGKEQESNASTEENLTIAADANTHQETTTAQNASSSVAPEKSTEETEININSEKNLEKRTAGLHVLSNVKVTPNTVLNISSLNSHIGDTISMKDVFIIGAASTSNSSSHKLVSKASASRTTSHVQQCTTNLSNGTDKKASKNSMEISSCVNGSDGTIYIDSDNDDEQLNTTATVIPSSDGTSAACSSKATSVIRMASQAASLDVKPTLRTSTANVKLPYNRPPKKLVVKLKKPFVPVIEEEANLHPPENETNSSLNEESVGSKHNTYDMDGNGKQNLLLECSEDVPYSPIRQSYTPQLPFNLYQNVDDQDEQVASSEILETKFVPSCSYNLDSDETLTNRTSFNEATELDSKQLSLDHKNEVIVFEISLEDSKDLQNAENDTLWKVNKGNNLRIESKDGNDSLMPGSCGTASTSLSLASEPTSSNNLPNPECSSGLSYRLPTFHRNYDDHVSTGNQLSRLESDASTSNPHFNSKYKHKSYELDKRTSYMNTDRCKNTSSTERAPSTDSLNIITDEKMPAKGEISEQESNGDIESSWSHQLFLDSENMPRYTSSYDTTVARESWSLSNEQNIPHEMENMSTILSNFTIIEQCDANIDIKPSTENLVDEAELSKGKIFVKTRKYRCPVCSQIFASLKEKRVHLISTHDYQEAFSMIRDSSRPSKNPKSQRPIATITSGSSSSAIISYDTPLIECKVEKTELTQIAKPFASLNNYLLNYNWNTLKGRTGTDLNLRNLFSIIDSGTNYVCKVCEEKFNSIRAYDIHMVVHPAECYTCGRTFKRWVNFSIHLKRHLNIREHCCSHCPKRFVLRQNMIEHMRIHSNEAPLKCSICMKRFKRYSNLIQHRNRHHLKLRPKDKDYICSCGEVFHSQAKIAWHRETHDAKPKCCPYCRERFMHKNSLVRHIRLSHTERFHLFKRDSVECPYCKKKYIKSSLKVHMEQHKASKTTYECTICNKSLTTKWNLKQHKWIHASRSSKPFKCTTCTKAFVRETEYISHMNTHKSIKPYTCDHCGCQFARKYNWLRHTREHTTPKNFRCDTCYKVFHRAYYLKEHKRSHTGERPFECSICGKTSTTKTNHNKHVKIHHARDPLTAEV